jgi:hypothetical protein
VADGARFGAVIGLIVGFGVGLILYGTWNLELAGFLADAVFQLVAWSAAGAAIGWAYSS